MEYGYVRVSSKSQAENHSLAEQEQTILEKYPSAEIHREVYTAAKDFNNRTVFNELVDRLVSGDILTICKMDRFCRNVREGLNIIDSLLASGIKKRAKHADFSRLCLSLHKGAKSSLIDQYPSISLSSYHLALYIVESSISMTHPTHHEVHRTPNV